MDENFRRTVDGGGDAEWARSVPGSFVSEEALPLLSFDEKLSEVVSDVEGIILDVLKRTAVPNYNPDTMVQVMSNKQQLLDHAIDALQQASILLQSAADL